MKIFNTLTRRKEEFVPLEEGKVKMYVCGPTVYNYFHIGNARPFVVFDTMRKYLEYRGYNVLHVQNFTDVDDKIINTAKGENCSWADLLIGKLFGTLVTRCRGMTTLPPSSQPTNLPRKR